MKRFSEKRVFFDIDAKRSSGISATDAELNAAIEVGQDVREWLLSIGVPASAILTAKSGNGVYVLVRLPDYEITKEMTALPIRESTFDLDAGFGCGGLF